MKIRTQLIISTVFFAIAVAVISASVVSTNQQVNRLDEQEELAKKIELKVGELSYLSNDYLLYHEGQQIDRWESKYSSISSDISNLTVSSPEQQVLVDDIKASHQRLKDIFGSIVSGIENEPENLQNRADPDFIQVSWSRMGVQTQGIVFDASRLSQMLREEADQARQQSNLLIFALMGVFVAFLFTDYLLIFRRTLNSISNLKDGTKVIGSGNLDYSLEEKKDDEIGELAQAFNLMTANLKTVTASKADLEREIAERKQAEEELYRSKELYRAIAKNFPSGTVYVFDRDLRFLVAEGEALGDIGWSREQLEDKSIYDLDEETRKIIEPRYRSVLAGQSLVFETPYRGRVIFSQYAPIRNDNGEIFAGLVVGLDITARKQAEEALRQSEERFRKVFEHTAFGMVIGDMEGRVLESNPAIERMLGYSKEDLRYRPFSEFTYPDDLTAERSQIEQIIAGQADHYQIEKRYLRKDGQIIWIRLIGSLTRDSSGNPLIGIALIEDITERKQAEESLRQSEARYRMLHESLRDSFVQVSMDGRIIGFNDLHCQMLGYSPEELRTLTYQDLTPERWHAFEESIVQEQIIRRGYSDVYGKEYRRKDGTIIPVELRTILSRDEEGQPSSMWGIVRDITERKQAEEQSQRLAQELADRVAELQAVLNAAPVAVWIAHDPECQVITGNAYADQILQAPQGGNVSRSAPPSEEAVSYKAFRNGIELKPEEMPAQVATATGKPVSGDELEMIFPDGRTIHLIESAVPLFDSQGHVRGAVIAGSDVTRLKLAEETLKRSRDELEQRVQERTAELSNAKEELESINEELQVKIEAQKKSEENLLVAKEAAEVAARTKAEFLANMSHEIRTPMNSIIGFTELLLDEPLSPVLKDNLETIRINGDALLTIINDILDFSKMESDRVVLEDQPFNLRALVEDSLDLASIKASEKGLNLYYTIDKGVPDTIIGDPGRLRQVLGNLLSNAVKFTDVGEVTISVSNQQVDGTNEIHFTVQDTGIGIPQGSMHQLFQPFNQMEPSTTRFYGGTGLGLAISKKLAELMGGRIWAVSEEGIGSRFHFTIRAPSGQVETEPPAVSPQLIGRHVLIIEDNKTNRRILSKQVYDWGMVPMAAKSGQEALSWVQRVDDFSVAILDVDLQDMDALELEEKIRKYNKTLPLVLLTPLGKRVPPNHAYLTKPIKPSQMHKVLTDILPEPGTPLRQPAQKPITTSEVNRPVQNSSLRILLAEDHISSQKVALQMLKKLGYKADVVANGIEVLQSLERQHYDVVLMDLKMPEMDGLEATRIVRQRWPDNGPKIIAITAYALEGDREKCLEAGMDDYISKPIQKEDLARALKDINRL